MTTTQPARPVHRASGLSRSPWPRRADRLAQALLASAAVVVLAAMLVNWLGVYLVVEGAPQVTALAVRTWTADAVTLLALGAAGIVHSLVRRGRPGRWPVLVLALLVPVVVVLAVPGLAQLP